MSWLYLRASELFVDAEYQPFVLAVARTVLVVTQHRASCSERALRINNTTSWENMTHPGRCA
jgi:hypothetical protein